MCRPVLYCAQPLPGVGGALDPVDFAGDGLGAGWRGEGRYQQRGRALAIASSDGAVRLRDVSYLTSPLAQLCARLGGSITPTEWARYVPADAAYRNACW